MSLQLPCWKEKKWAMHVVTRFFDRYGSPSNVSAEYNDFASWFLKTFAVGILNSVLTVLAGYGAKADGSKKYVSPRVLQQCLNYVNTAVAHAVTWKVMKVRGHVMPLVSRLFWMFKKTSRRVRKKVENSRICQLKT